MFIAAAAVAAAAADVAAEVSRLVVLGMRYIFCYQLLLLPLLLHSY